MQPGKEQRLREAGAGTSTGSMRDALDEPALPQAAQVVCHLPRMMDSAGMPPSWAMMAAGRAGRTAGKKPGYAQGRHEGVGAGIAQAQARDEVTARSGDRDAGLRDGGLAIGGVAAESLDGEHAAGDFDDALQLEDNMAGWDIGSGTRWRHQRFRSTGPHRPATATCGHVQGQIVPPPRSGPEPLVGYPSAGIPRRAP